MNFKYISLLFLCLIVNVAQAQDGLVWMKFFDADSGGNFEHFYDVYANADGSYITVGHSNSFILAVKYDSEGDMVWSETYGDGGYDYARSVIECDNGDFLIGGWLAETARTTNIMAMRINDMGELLWMNDYGEGGCDAVIELKDGRFALAGQIGAENAGIILINSEGEEIIRRAYPHGDRSSFRAIREADNAIVALSQWRGTRVWMTEVDLNLEPQWLHDYDFINAYSISVNVNSLVSINDGYAFCVTVAENRGNIHKPEILVTDRDGEIVWRQRYSLDREPFRGHSICSLGDEGFIVAGGESIASLLNVNNNGDFLWQASYVEEDNEDYDTRRLFSIIRDRDGDFVFCGYGVARNTSGCGMIAKIDGLQFQPLILQWSPNDTLQNILQGDSIQFALNARIRDEGELNYEFWVVDTLFGEQGTITVRFDSLGIFTVEGRVIYDQSITSIRWHVTVTDLYISGFTPDTLNLTLPRSSSVDFSTDTVRYTDGDPPEYLWTVTTLDNNEQSHPGAEAGATITFNQSGNYSVEGLAYRGESSDAVTWNITVRGAIWAFAPEELAFEVLPDSLIQFDVLPTVPDAEEQTIRWLVDGEVVAEDTTGFTWRADFNPPYLAIVQVVVADTVESDSVSWEVTVREPDAVDDKRDAYPVRMELLSVSPNPFNSMLSIRYDVGARHAVPLQIAIYDIAGRMVAVIPAVTSLQVTDKRNTTTRRGAAAENSVVWDASSIPAGVYFVRLQSGRNIATKKVVLMK